MAVIVVVRAIVAALSGCGHSNGGSGSGSNFIAIVVAIDVGDCVIGKSRAGFSCSSECLIINNLNE